MSERVSPNTSLIAEQISSVDTVTTSSTSFLHSRKFSVPRVWMPTSSVNRLTLGMDTSEPSSSDFSRRLAPSASTPITFTWGATSFTYAARPAIKPPPPTGTKIAAGRSPAVCSQPNQRQALAQRSKNSSCKPRPRSYLFQDLHADRSVAGDHERVVERVDKRSTLNLRDAESLFLQWSPSTAQHQLELAPRNGNATHNIFVVPEKHRSRRRAPRS
jgi:hypothetical protein